MEYVLLITFFVIKHFIADFLYQPPYQWQNKGTYGHLGGLLHSGQHALLTLLLTFFYGPIIVILAGLEFWLHYHIDWAKMNINKKFGWTATTHNEFWILLGIDQLLHGLTYIALIAMLLI